jgi:hypothetical protein
MELKMLTLSCVILLSLIFDFPISAIISGRQTRPPSEAMWTQRYKSRSKVSILTYLLIKNIQSIGLQITSKVKKDLMFDMEKNTFKKCPPRPPSLGQILVQVKLLWPQQWSI